MKKSSALVIVIPLIVVALVVGSVIVVRTHSPVPDVGNAAFREAPSENVPGYTVPTTKPSAGFDTISDSSPVSDLRKDFDATGDSGSGAFDALSSEAASL